MEVTGKKTNPRFGTQGPIASFQKLLETLKAQHREQPLAGSCTVAVHQLVSGEWLHCRYSIYMCVCVIIIALSFPSSSFIIINDFYLNLQLLLFFQFSPSSHLGRRSRRLRVVCCLTDYTTTATTNPSFRYAFISFENPFVTSVPHLSSASNSLALSMAVNKGGISDAQCF